MMLLFIVLFEWSRNELYISPCMCTVVSSSNRSEDKIFAAQMQYAQFISISVMANFQFPKLSSFTTVHRNLSQYVMQYTVYY